MDPATVAALLQAQQTGNWTGNSNDPVMMGGQVNYVSPSGQFPQGTFIPPSSAGTTWQNGMNSPWQMGGATMDPRDHNDDDRHRMPPPAPPTPPPAPPPSGFQLPSFSNPLQFGQAAANQLFGQAQQDAGGMFSGGSGTNVFGGSPLNRRIG